MKEITILWLDDVRNPDMNDKASYFNKILKLIEKNKPINPKQKRNITFYQKNIFNQYKPNFVWVKNIEEFQNYILNNGLPEFISFDNDLTPKGWKGDKFKSGKDCAIWLMKYCRDTNQKVPRCFVHSANDKQRPEVENELGNNVLKQELVKENKIKLSESQLRNVIKRCIKETMSRDLWDTYYEGQDEYDMFKMPDGYDDEWNEGLDNEISDWYMTDPDKVEQDMPHLFASHKGSNLNNDYSEGLRDDEINRDWSEYENGKLNESKLNKIVSRVINKYTRGRKY